MTGLDLAGIRRTLAAYDAIMSEPDVPFRQADAVAHRLAAGARVLVGEVERLRALLGSDDGRHIVEFRADGWTIQHPLSCRPNLFACEVNRAAGRELTEPPAELGVFACRIEGGRFVVGDPS